MKYALMDGQGRTIAIAEADSAADATRFGERRVPGFKKLGTLEEAAREYQELNQRMDAAMARLHEAWGVPAPSGTGTATHDRNRLRPPYVVVTRWALAGEAEIAGARQREQELREADAKITETLRQAGFVGPKQEG